MTKQLKPACEFRQFGRSILIKFKGEKNQHTFTSPDKEKREELKHLVDLYNKLPNETKKNKILKIIAPKAQAALMEKTAKKKQTGQKIKKAKAELKEIKQLAAKEEEAALVVQQFLAEDKRLLMQDGEVYLLPYTSVPMPVDLVEEFKRAIIAKETARVEALINFWLLCLLNPNPIARAKFFRYLSKHNLVITPNGYVVTYRMVKKTENPDVFTSAHTGKEEYRMGEVFRMPRTQCDEDGANDCSRGLHVGTPAFIGLQGLEKLGDGYKKTNPQYGTGYGPANDTFSESFGNQAVIVLLNPAHVVSVPNSDTRKLRACELYFVKTTTVQEVRELQTGDFATYDNSYKTLEKEELLALLKETKLENYTSEDVPTNVKKVTAKKVAEYQEQVKKLKESLTISKDTVNKDLTLDQINQLIQARLKS
jgi:hypothetical protein